MDTEQEELQFLGFTGICHEANKLVLSWRRLFSQISLSLILPLSITFLAHVHITSILFTKIDVNEAALDKAPEGSPAEDMLLSRLLSQWAAFLLFKAFYLLAVLVFSLLSTSAVVYTVACVYTGKDVTFKNVVAVVPKVWKRLMITFLWSFAILSAYNAAAVLVLILVYLILGLGFAGVPMLVVICGVYAVGLVYISVVWHLASVVSVMEDVYGISAMQKSKALVKGQERVAVGVFVVFHLMFVVVEVVFGKVVVHGEWLGLGLRVGLAVMMMSLLSMLILFGLVSATVFYFVCKSYHHERIDKRSLAEHLEEYLGEYVPLMGKDVQLQQF